MLKQILLAASLLISTNTLWAQKNFPELKGTNLNDKEISVPADTKGKYTLIGIAYSKKSEDQLKEWLQPVYTTFIDQPESSFLPVDEYDVNIYFIPMLSGIVQSASGKITDKMKKEIDKDLHDYILVYEGEIKSYKEVLNMPDKDSPYFFVLDENGKIVHSCSGAFTQKKLDKILEVLDQD